MGKVILNAFLLLTLIVSVGASWLLTLNPARPNFEFLPQMAHAPRYNAFSPIRISKMVRPFSARNRARFLANRCRSTTRPRPRTHCERVRNSRTRSPRRTNGPVTVAHLSSQTIVRFVMGRAEQGTVLLRSVDIRLLRPYWPSTRRK